MVGPYPYIYEFEPRGIVNVNYKVQYVVLGRLLSSKGKPLSFFSNSNCTVVNYYLHSQFQNMVVKNNNTEEEVQRRIVFLGNAALQLPSITIK